MARQNPRGGWWYYTPYEVSHRMFSRLANYTECGMVVKKFGDPKISRGVVVDDVRYCKRCCPGSEVER